MKLQIHTLLQRLRLHVEIAVARHGFWLPLTVVLAILSIVLWLVAIPSVKADITQKQKALTTLEKYSQTPTITLPILDKNTALLELFEKNIADQKSLSSALQTIFSTAKKHGITLSKAEYKNGHHRNGYYNTTQITLPLQGNYNAIRRFSLDVLSILPFCSMDEIVFKREAIGASQVEARIRLTLWLKALPTNTVEASSITQENIL